MTDFLIYFAFSVISYLLGSINTGILVSKILYNDDVRNYGSHNAGATNILRTYGKKAAAITVLGDALKGVTAILIVRAAYLCLKSAPLPDERSVTYAAAFFAVLGHNFPVFFGFKGGKGVLTSITVIIMLDPFIGVMTLIVSVLIMAATRYVSLGSVMGALIVAALAIFLRTDDIGFVVLCVLLAALLIYRHRSNLVRLVHGTESKLGRRKK